MLETNVGHKPNGDKHPVVQADFTRSIETYSQDNKFEVVIQRLDVLNSNLEKFIAAFSKVDVDFAKTNKENNDNVDKPSRRTPRKLKRWDSIEKEEALEIYLEVIKDKNTFTDAAEDHELSKTSAHKALKRHLDPVLYNDFMIKLRKNRAGSKKTL